MDDSTFDFGTLIEKSITILGRGAKTLRIQTPPYNRIGGSNPIPRIGL